MSKRPYMSHVFFSAIPDSVAIVVVVDVLPAVVDILHVVVIVAVVDDIVAYHAWCIVPCRPTVQCSIPSPIQFRLASFCAGRPLMRWAEDARCLSLHVDRGVTWRWGQ